MKPILINIQEMSDSREVYESKPNIFFTLFIYFILGMLIIALIWMYFGRIDVVVKSEGMLRPNNQVATVVNTYGGTLETVNIEDGSSVQEGDTLYIVEHWDLLTEFEYYEEQLSETDRNLDFLNKYKQSVEDGINYFAETSDEEEYFLKYQGYAINYGLMENDFLYSDKERELNLNTISDQLDFLKSKLIYIDTLKQAINQNKNQFENSGKEQEYYNLFLKYQSDYDSLTVQYNNAKVEIDNSTTEEGLVNSLGYYTGVLEGLKQLKASVLKGKSLFKASGSYSLQYEDFVNKKSDLTITYEQAKENYGVNKELEGLAVTEWEVQQSKVAMEEADRATDAYEVNYLANISSNIIEVEKSIKEITLSKENTISKDKLYEKNDKDKLAALDNYKLKYIVELDNSMASLTENITSLEANKSNLELQDEKTFLVKEEDCREANLVEYKNNELRTAISNINTYSDKKSELQANIDKINSQIDGAIVKATKTGVVNSYIELVEGDILSNGTEVLTIIPEEDKEYKASIYVSNEDIGKLGTGMKAKFNVYALPNSEYGYLTGTVTNISKDLKVDPKSGSGYYLVEAEVDNKAFYDSQGNKALLKAGMACQAQLITENKRILTYVLEKIDLWID
jgi:multidrug efflux pump subunit AcrA (membrane-fusion protein)